MDETDSTKTRVVTLGEHLHKLIAVAEAAKEYRAAVRRRNTTQRQYIALCQALDELEKRMSATNWRECPQCIAIQESKRRSKLDRAVNQYGKVGHEQFLRLISDARKEDELGDTLREDYQMRVDQDGKFVVSYSARCDQCGYKFNFRHVEQTEIQLDGK